MPWLEGEIPERDRYGEMLWLRVGTWNAWRKVVQRVGTLIKVVENRISMNSCTINIFVDC